MRTARPLATLAVVTTAAGLLLTGCGSDADDTTVGDAAGGDTTSVAIPAAPGTPDPGKYRTSPQPAFGNAGSESMGRIVEGQRMAEFVTLPGEIDPQLTVLAGLSTYVIKNATATKNLLGEKQVAVAEQHNMVVGFSTSRHTPGNLTQNKSIVHAVLRFPDADAAKQAAQEISQAGLEPTVDGKPISWGVKRPTNIDILPNTFVAISAEPNKDGRVVTEAVTAHGDYVLYDWVEAPEADKDWQATVIAKSLSLQGPAIDKFPATPVADLPNLPIDIDGVLVNTVPPVDGKRRTNQLAVYGPHGAAHFQSEGLQNLQDFTETGTTRIATDATTVYRVEAAKGATELFTRWVEEYTGTPSDPTDVPWTKIAGPAGVPDVQCLSNSTTTGTAIYYCLVQKGNYVGETGGTEEADVKQRITAQYMILDVVAQQ
jgi:hypothetical protein